ncbi:MAG: hypothetical protein FP820_05580 [Sulfurimonas sp.]|nr:hypothetical protein [Sulfurimonas sp.]MBU3938969.1 hypothetical protein [bacterium]MBU4024827.1 hypothetical protein [bacterium]MBU4060171.1 hypothetical protein [bacterium]MBU4109811.1 hypothetical protein [bacterium]
MKVYSLVIGFIALMVSGCTANIAALSNCSESGEAYYGNLPIASGSEHQQALKFTPSDPENCVVYVIRESDFWTGKSVRDTKVILASIESQYSLFPILETDLIFHLGNQVGSITDDVYLMWELKQGSYLLETYFDTYYGYLSFLNWTGGNTESYIAQVQLECKPGDVKFFGVGDRDYVHHVVLKELDKEIGKQYIRNSVRSVGVGDSKAHDYKDCPVDK